MKILAVSLKGKYRHIHCKIDRRTDGQTGARMDRHKRQLTTCFAFSVLLATFEGYDGI